MHAHTRVHIETCICIYYKLCSHQNLQTKFNTMNFIVPLIFPYLYYHSQEGEN
jgi:hypothetical protein